MLNTMTQSLGVVSWPLFVAAAVALVLIIERIAVLTLHSFSKQPAQKALSLLQQHENQPRELREEVLQVWLRQQQQRFASGIRLLHVVAVIAPVLGLLGTVLGLIEVFQVVSLQSGPVEPALLADGLGLAMRTTAAGLIIALPSLLGAHVFQLWVDRLMAHLEKHINVENLKMAGICTRSLA